MKKKIEMKLPRGIRNNNPLNIVYTKANNWHGQLSLNKVIEPRFCRFSSMMWGFRAAACILRKYINVYKCNTIRLICAKWAPRNENNTESYTDTVAKSVGINADTKIEFKNQMVMLRLMSAMCVVENGTDFDPQQDFNLWDDMYRGYVMARESTTDFKSIKDYEG